MMAAAVIFRGLAEGWRQFALQCGRLGTPFPPSRNWAGPLRAARALLAKLAAGPDLCSRVKRPAAALPLLRHYLYPAILKHGQSGRTVMAAIPP